MALLKRDVKRYFASLTMMLLNWCNHSPLHLLRLLVCPEPYRDESLGSYLFRLSQENDFERYALLSGAIRESLLALDHEAGGACHAAVHRAGVDIPRVFIRSSPIPVCPACWGVKLGVVGE